MYAYHIRNFQDADIDLLVTFVNETLAASGLTERITEEAIRYQISLPFINAAEDFFVAVAPDGSIVGTATNMVNPRVGRAGSTVLVRADYLRASDLATQLVQRSDTAILNRGAALVPPDVPIYVDRQVIENMPGYAALVAAQGYTLTRVFYEMIIEFAGDLPPAVLPAGLVLRPFDAAQHARAVHQAHQESFRDHWGHVEDTPFDDWVHRLESPDYDPALWLVVWDGDEIAGIALCLPTTGEANLGWVEILGVRRQWRRRGLAQALLQQAFYLFGQRGLTRAGLGVDADSRTNAVALYERAGMHVRKRAFTYRKILRGTAAMIQD